MTNHNGPTAHTAPHFFERKGFSPASSREKQILGAVMRRGPLSQNQLTRLTGMAQQSMSRIVNKLFERGALKTGTRITNGKRGQRSITVEIVPEFAYSFGISIMTDAIYVTAMDFSGTVLAEEHAAMHSMNQKEVIQQIKQIISKLSSAHIQNPTRIFGVGVGISGYSVDRGAKINTPHMLDEWALIDIEQILSSHLQLPVWVENDGNVAAIGESLVGAGKQINNFIYLFIATGFGGGVISNGELIRGAHGNAGELALLLPNNIYPHPNLELLRHLVVKNGGYADTVSDLIDNFDPNWQAVDEWISRVRDSLSLVASASAAILDTEAIVLGGRIPKYLAEQLIPHIVILDNTRRSLPRPMPKIIVAQAEGDSSSIGAAVLPFKECFFG